MPGNYARVRGRAASPFATHCYLGSYVVEDCVAIQQVQSLDLLDSWQLCGPFSVPDANMHCSRDRIPSESDNVAALGIRRVVEAYLKGGLLTNDQPEAQRKLL
jgi:hypothetical protein